MSDQSGDTYRLCSQCGVEFSLDPFATETQGPRVAFICAEHGVNAVLDPFDSDE